MKLLSFSEYRNLIENNVLDLGPPAGSKTIIPDMQLDTINSELDLVLVDPFITQYIGIEKIKNTLANHGFHLEGFSVALDPEDGYITKSVLALNNTDELATDYFIYYEWHCNEMGTYDTFASIVNMEDLRKLVDAYTEEIE